MELLIMKHQKELTNALQMKGFYVGPFLIRIFAIHGFDSETRGQYLVAPTFPHFQVVPPYCHPTSWLCWIQDLLCSGSWRYVQYFGSHVSTAM